MYIAPGNAKEKRSQTGKPEEFREQSHRFSTEVIVPFNSHSRGKRLVLSIIL